MYEKYWGFKEKPFENVCNLKYFFKSESHIEAISRMTYTVKERKGAMVLTGDYGTGKTLTLRWFIENTEEIKFLFIDYPEGNPENFMKQILISAGEEIEEKDRFLLSQKIKELILKNTEEGINTVMIIDEAQTLEDPLFEVIKILLNLRETFSADFSVILSGSEKLIHKIKQNEQLLQRIPVYFHLTALSYEETVRYIDYRLEVAGGDTDIFDETAKKKIYELSKGIPRKINNLCDTALLIGFGKKEKKINDKIIELAEREILP